MQKFFDEQNGHVIKKNRIRNYRFINLSEISSKLIRFTAQRV